jgi:hypothetical protein
MPNNLPSINLGEEKEISSFGGFIDWVLTVGRIIVIATEIIAIAAFIYRFSLDEKLVSLHSEIKQNQTTISSLKNDEDKYRNLQSRIALAKDFSEKGIKTSQAIADFGKLIPNQAKTDSLIFNKDQINVIVNVDSVSLLADFINSLKSYNGIKSISINSIENKTSVGLSVNIVTVLK